MSKYSDTARKTRLVVAQWHEGEKIDRSGPEWEAGQTADVDRRAEMDADLFIYLLNFFAEIGYDKSE